MAQLPQLKRLLIEDFPDQQEWISKLILPLNEFMQNVINALNRDLTLSDNLRANLKTLRITGSSTVSGDIYADSNVIFRPSSLEGLVAKLPVENENIPAGTTVSSIFTNEFIDAANTTAVGTNDITGISSTVNYIEGQPISGPGIPINSTVYSIVSGTAIKINNLLIAGGSATANIKLERGILLSQAAIGTALGAKINCGGSYPMYFQYNMAVRPTLVYIGAIVENSANPEVIKVAPFIDWGLGQNQVIIRNITGLTAGKEYTITFVLIGS